MHSVPSYTSSCYANPSHEPSNFEHDTFSNSHESYNATKSATIDTYDTAYHIGDTSHNSKLPPNDTESSTPCWSSAHEVDPAHTAYIPVTSQALQQQNTKNKLSHGETVTKFLLGEGRGYVTAVGDAAGDTPIMTPYESMEVEPQIDISAMPKQKYEQHIGAGFLNHAGENQAPYPYPLCIQQADLNAQMGQPLDHQIGQAESYVDAPPTQHVLIQGPASYSYALTGVGAQFSAPG